MKTLAEWMRDEGIRDKEMGVKLGLSESQVSRLRRRLCSPNRKTMANILRVTDRSVTPNDMLIEEPAAADVAPIQATA